MFIVINYPSAPPKPQEDVDYLKKPDYGQVPDYLNSIKDTIADEKMVEKLKLDEANKEKTRELTKKEKDDILVGLRTNLKGLDEEYRRLPVTINTFGQKNKYVHSSAIPSSFCSNIILEKRHWKSEWRKSRRTFSRCQKSTCM